MSKLKKEKEIKRVKISTPRPGSRGLTTRFILSQLSLKRLPYVLGFCIIIVFLLNPFLGVNTKDYRLGELVDRDIKAPFTMSVTDRESTEKEKLAAENAVLPVYDYDNYNEENFESSSYYKRIREAFSLMRRRYNRAGASGAIKVELSTYELEILKKEFDKEIGAEIPEKTFEFLAGSGFSSRFERIILLLLKNALKSKIISKNDLENIDVKRGIILNYLRERGDHQISFKSFDTVTTVEKARESVERSIREIFPAYSRLRRKALFGFFEKVVSPTLTFNREKTEAEIAKARESVKPVVINIKKGEMVIRDGTFISKRELMILRAVKEKSIKKYSVSYLIGAFFMILIFYVAICSFSARFIKKFRSGDKDIFVMGLSIVMLLLVFSGYSAFISSLSGKIGTLQIMALQYLFPFALGAMVIRLILNSETAIIYAFFQSMLFGIFLEKNLFFAIFVFFSSIIAAGMIGYAQDRAVLMKAGIKTGVFNVFLILVINMLSTVSEPAPYSVIFYSAMAGFFGGILSALLTYGVIPILEWSLKYTTDIRLLELANLNQPLLRELMVQCPGTYHHSMVVGNLVEAGAEAIQANSLYARVAAYYHDIGKLRKPDYFIENIKEKENKHDKLTPNMSALILISHLKDGVEQARENDLGAGICDIIHQHHGTTLIKYFYHKAQEQAGEDKVVDEKEFRYPGPKPQTREAALVMIADQVEAVVRSLSDPSHSRIKGSVRAIIDGLFADGQFEESDLTLRDLNTISVNFVRVLAGMHHYRIDYPSAAKGTEKSESVNKAKEEFSRDKHRAGKTAPQNSSGRSGNHGYRSPGS